MHFRRLLLGAESLDHEVLQLPRKSLWTFSVERLTDPDVAFTFTFLG